MKNNMHDHCRWILVFSFLSALFAANALADKWKANNTNNLNLASSWTNNAVPADTEFGTWDATVAAENTTNTLGADMTWGGIRIIDPGHAIILNAGSSLALNGVSGAGIDMSSATQNLTLNNSTILNAPQIWDVGSGRTLTVGGAISGDYSLIKGGSGTLVLDPAGVTNSYSGGTSVGAGVLQLGGSTATTSAGSGPVTMTNGTTLRFKSAYVTIGNVLDVNGTIAVDLNNVNGNVAMDGAWMGSGTVNIINQQNTSGRVFTIGGGGAGGGGMNAFTGTINFGTNSQYLRFNDGGPNNNLGSADATFDLGTSTGIFLSRNRNARVNFGALLGGPNTTMEQGGNNSGTTLYNIGGNNLSTTFAGRIIDSGTTTNGLIAVTKVGTGTLTLAGMNTYAGPTTVSNGTLSVTGSLGTNNVTVTPDATLAGTGTINGPVTVQLGGALAPGVGGIGTLTVNDTLTLAGTTVLEINRPNSPNCDLLTGIATLTYGGALTVSNLGPDLQPGDTFKLFDAASYSGSFTSISPDIPGTGMTWDTNHLTVDGTLSVISSGDFDARIELTENLLVPASDSQKTAEAALRTQIPQLSVEYDRLTGAGRTFYNMIGFLTDASSGTPMTNALEYVQAHLDLLGITNADLEDMEVTDSVSTPMIGATHLYWRQRHLSIPLYNGQLQVNLAQSNRILSVNNAFLPNLAASVNTNLPAISAAEAVRLAALTFGIYSNLPPATLGPPQGAERITPIQPDGFSAEPIEAKLRWLAIQQGEARLVWNFQLFTHDPLHAYDFTVDAVSGAIWTRFDWVKNAASAYKVYAMPVSSPVCTSPLPPGDARTIVTDPANATASPFGWHNIDGVNYTIMRGNNVHAYEDIDHNGLPPAVEPDGGPLLNFVFPLDLTSRDPSDYRDAAVANLFYWCNIIHDIQFQYGFDENGGNFQAHNYTAQGLDNDDVQARAQYGGGFDGTCFVPQPDGHQPGLYMMLHDYYTGSADPRDSDLENTIIIHEYGHGISSRLIGGPSQISVVNNRQAPSEGWSDWWALVYTHKPGDQASDWRTFSTYVDGQSCSGAGARPYRYFANPSGTICTYESIRIHPDSHGIGCVWCEVLWNAYWALIDRWGYDPNLYDATGGHGNQRMMFYVNEGLKNTMPSPTFINARDGIIQAAIASNGGEDVCTLWGVFAQFGLGSDAKASPPGTDDPDSVSPVNGFSLPDFGASDVFIADTPYDWTGTPDAGGEPDANMVGADFWKSGSIWVRHAQDGQTAHQNPISGQVNYVYVTLRNSGPRVPPSPATGTLELYYAQASVGLTWPGDWHRFATLPSLTLAANETRPVVAPWTPPDLGHFCLMAMWNSCQDPLPPLTPDMTVNTAHNNNVAWRNVEVKDLQHAVDPPSVWHLQKVLPSGSSNAAAPVQLLFTADQDFLTTGGQVFVNLGPVFARWQAAGGLGSNVVNASGTVVRLLGSPATLDGIPVDLGEDFLVTMTIGAPEPMPVPGTNHLYVVDVVEVVEGHRVGGVSYAVTTRALDTDSDHDGIPDVADPDNDNDGVPYTMDPNPLDPDIPSKACIAGAVFNDLNGNGIWSTNKPPLAAWIVSLFSGTNLMASTASDGRGYYYFEALTNGAYSVLEVPQSGWVQTVPAGAAHTVTLTNTQGINGLNFGNRQIATNPTNIAWTVNGSQLTLSWPADHIGWQLEGQTNSLGIGLSTNWFVVPDSSSTNQLTIPVNDNGCVFYRLRYGP